MMRITFSVFVSFIAVAALVGSSVEKQAASQSTSAQSTIFPKGELAPAEFFTGKA
jgi:hypothetical protein